MCLVNVIMLLPLFCRLSVFPFSCVSPSLSQRAYVSRINWFLETGCLFPSTDMKPQLPSRHEVRGSGRWLTHTAVRPDASELTAIFHVEKFYTNFSLVIMDVFLNTSSSSQISVFSYLNIHFCSIMSATALLRLHTGSLLDLQSLVIMLNTNQSFSLTGTRPSSVRRWVCQDSSCYASDQILTAAILIHLVLRVSCSWKHGGAVADARVSLNSLFFIIFYSQKWLSHV